MHVQKMTSGVIIILESMTAVCDQAYKKKR